MRYTSKEVRDAFSREPENYHKPLALLEEVFRRAGLNVEFEGCLLPVTVEHKAVFIYRDGFAHMTVSIKGGSPAMAVADVARGVMLT